MKLFSIVVLLAVACLASGVANADEKSDAATLKQLLGDPQAVGKDYLMLGNSAALLSALPGRWLMTGWSVVADFVEGDKVAKACAKNGVDIAPSGRDVYALTATGLIRKETGPLFDLLWTGGNSFVMVRNLQNTLERFGLDPAKQGLAPAFGTIHRAVQRFTFLAVSDTTLVAVPEDGAEAQVLLRCPAP